MTTIKFCGLRREEDILAVNRIRPDYAGMILSAGYKRSVNREQAKQLNLGKESFVFIDDNPNNVAAANALGITGVLFESKDKLVKELNGFAII